jgi:uncharacterized damage-inducible protein DinB
VTKAEALELFAYNAWANRQMFDAAAALPADLYQQDLKSSHGGVHGTLAHIVWAEHLWLNRWLTQPNPAVAQGKDLHTAADVRARWEEIEAERGAFLARLGEAQIDEMRTVKPSTGGEYLHTFGQMFRHTVDHSSYHRGQVVTMLRQLGVAPPVTGLIFFYRRG